MSRRDLARQPGFDEVSPEVGELDDEVFGDLMDDDLDAALTLLAEMTGATDERLRSLALQLAGRVLVDVARAGTATRRGVGRLRPLPASAHAGDVDLDASLERVAAARRQGRPASLDDLTVLGWRRPGTALCLLVDRSGSMRGDRLATAAIAAAAVLYRNGHDCSVVAFSDTAVVVRSQEGDRVADDVVGDLLRLRGHGVTDVGLALRTAAAQLGRSTAGRRIALLLSDCRSTSGDDPTPDAAALAGVAELAVIAPEGDTADAEALAAAAGARCVTVAGPSSIPAAIELALA